MSNVETATQAAGTGFPVLGIVTVVFVIAKIFHLISWSWWLVFLPLYGPLAVVLAAIAALLLVVGVLSLIGAVAERAAHRNRRARRPF